MPSKNPEDQFNHWDQNTKKEIKKSPVRILSQISFNESKIDLSRVKQNFMSAGSLYMKDQLLFVNISHWNGDEIPWNFQGSVNSHGLFHGVCKFTLPSEYYNTTGTHNFLNWSINYFAGNFENGKLEGVGLFVTWDGANVLATFNNGEMHGPALGFGRIPIFDIQVQVDENSFVQSFKGFLICL